MKQIIILESYAEVNSNYPVAEWFFFPIALVLIMIFSWSIERDKRCLHRCCDRPGRVAEK